MRRSQLPVTVLATCLVAVAVPATATADTGHPAVKHDRCSHHANPPRDGDNIELGDTTRHVGIKKLRGFHKVREGKRVCIFKSKAPRAVLKLSATYRPGTRSKMMKRYAKARTKPGFKRIRVAKGSKVPSSKGRRTVVEYTFGRHGKRRHVRINGDAQVVFFVSSPQRTWKATKKAAGKIRRSMKITNLTAM